MPVIRLRNVNRVTPKGPGGPVYHYHRKTGERLPDDPNSVAFRAAWEREERKIEAGEAAIQGTLGDLITRYRRSIEFTEKAPRTRSDYQQVFDWLEPTAGRAVAEFTAPFVFAVRDRAFKQRKRDFANKMLAVLSLLFNWGQPRGLTSSNPAAAVPKIRRPKTAPQMHRPWKPEELEAMLQAASPGLAAAIALGGFAGLRRQDVVAVPWSAYDGKEVHARQLKTGDPVWIKANSRLREILDRTPKVSTQIVAGDRGQPYTLDGFDTMFQRLRDKLEAAGKVEPGLTFHGLRHTTAVNLYDAGADKGDIMAVTGHRSESSLDTYLRGIDRRRKAARAIDVAEQTTLKSAKRGAKSRDRKRAK